ncbi:MAG: trigger factor, partial [Nannocystaceae bacterium]
MESQLEKISAVECRVRVTIPWNQLEGRFNGKFKELKGRVRLPGFRPGKVPLPMLERLYGSSVRQELARDLVQETFETAVGQHDTTPLTKPVMESGSIEREQDFTYTARFEVAPSIEPDNYTGLDVRRRPSAGDEAKVDARLEQKRAELTEVQPIPEDSDRTKTRDGDIWTVDVVGKLGSQDINVKEARVELGSSNELLPGLGAEFAAIAAEATRGEGE